MTRQLTSHTVNPVNDKLTITVRDEPALGGANYRYEIEGMDHTRNPSYLPLFGLDNSVVTLLFQNGNPDEAGVNGITHEALLAVLIDRLEGFQRGPFASPYNEGALDHLRAAQDMLLTRTRERMKRGVEGKLEK